MAQLTLLSFNFITLAIIFVFVPVMALVVYARVRKVPSWFTAHQTFIAAWMALLAVLLATQVETIKALQAEYRQQLAIGQALMIEAQFNLSLVNESCSSDTENAKFPNFQTTIFRDYNREILLFPSGFVLVPQLESLFRNYSPKGPPAAPDKASMEIYEGQCGVAKSVLYSVLLLTFHDMNGIEMPSYAKERFGIPLAFDPRNWSSHGSRVELGFS